MKSLLLIALVLYGHSYAATIFMCKAYNGSTFWSSATCSTHNALIDRIETVADVPWDQQVQQAEANKARREGRSQQAPQVNSAQYCAQLANELYEIESRYSKGQWQPVDVVNPDQKRTVAIRNELRRFNCRVQ